VNVEWEKEVLRCVLNGLSDVFEDVNGIWSGLYPVKSTVGGWRRRFGVGPAGTALSDEGSISEDGPSGEVDGGGWGVDKSLGGRCCASAYAGTTRFRLLIVDFFICTGRCEPCNL